MLNIKLWVTVRHPIDNYAEIIIKYTRENLFTNDIMHD